MRGKKLSRAERYDQLRSSILEPVKAPNTAVWTRGVSEHFGERLKEVLEKVASAETFLSGHRRDHDFGEVEVGGKRVWWKIDDYQGQEGLELVLTVLFPEEY